MNRGRATIILAKCNCDRPALSSLLSSSVAIEMLIGVPREQKDGQVVLEKGAGERVGIGDAAYAELPLSRWS